MLTVAARSTPCLSPLSSFFMKTNQFSSLSYILRTAQNATLLRTYRLTSSQAASNKPDQLVQPRASGAPPTDKNYPPKVLALADEVLKLTLLEISDLNEIIRTRLGIQNIAYAAPVGIIIS